MINLRTIQTTAQLAIGTVLLSLVLRTWLVMGVIAPVEVAGSSMAPTLRGPYVVAKCPRCRSEFSVGAEFAALSPHVDCPNCAELRLPLDGLAIQDSDRLWIDRTAAGRRPRRGVVVVLRNPHDGTQLCVKRVVGLPGETVTFREGDAWIDGQPWKKTLAQQRAVRQLLNYEAGRLSRWQTDSSGKWQRGEREWRLDSRTDTAWHWLKYSHQHGKPVTDDVVYNAAISRRLNLVRDFALSTELTAQGAGQFALEVNDGRQTSRVTVTWPEGKLNLTTNGQSLRSAVLSAKSRQELARGDALVELSNFDRQVLLAINSRVELREPLTDASPPTGTSQPFAIGAMGMRLALGELTIYRDIYYTRQVVGEVGKGNSAVLPLGRDEYYLLGDNSPLSLDSRSWGGVSLRLLLGCPLGVR